jgi:uncharacterized membrane protein YciS (DUF1049 family)
MRVLGVLVAIIILIVGIPVIAAIIGGVTYAYLVTEGPFKALLVLALLLGICWLGWSWPRRTP